MPSLADHFEIFEIGCGPPRRLPGSRNSDFRIFEFLDRSGTFVAYPNQIQGCGAMAHLNLSSILHTGFSNEFKHEDAIDVKQSIGFRDKTVV